MEPPQSETGTPATSAPRRRGRKQLLLVALAVVALLCLGGAGAAFVFYDKATQPDRGTPVGVTLEYLRAYLVDRDDARAAQYQCSDTAGLKDVKAFRDDVDNREKTYNVTITTAIDGVFETARSGSTATTKADLVLRTTIQGQEQRAVEHWQFTTRDEDGWRVCEGHEVT
jgi:hypothetical protein